MEEKNEMNVFIPLDRDCQKDQNGKYILTGKNVILIVNKLISLRKELSAETRRMIVEGKNIDVVIYHSFINLEAFSFNSRRKIIKKYLLSSFNNSKIVTRDGKQIGIKSTGGADKLLFLSKQKIALIAPELVQASVFFGEGCDYINSQIKWLYYDVFFSIDEKTFYGRINIKSANGQMNLYDINKIKEVFASTPLNMEHSSNLNNNISNDESNVKSKNDHK